MTAPRVFHADAAVIGDGTAIRDAAVVLDSRGTLLDVGPAADVFARSTGAPRERLRGVILPGLVNAHTHLELSAARGKTTPGAGFVPWLDSLRSARAGEDEAERDAAIDRAIAQLIEQGVVAVGEVTNTLVAWGRLAKHLLGTVFHEVIGVAREAGLSAVEGIERARDEAAPSREHRGSTVWAPTPHSLFAVHPDAVRTLVARAERDGTPLSVHLAEHAAERAFLADGGGPCREFMVRIGLARAVDEFPIPRLDPLAFARALGVTRRGAALVHLTDSRPRELDGLAESGAVAVLCPRSNLFVEARLPPLLALRAAGVPLAIGTDSLASAPSLDPLAECRALAERTPEVPASALVAAATSGGARAIGWGADLGRLAVGTRPGVIHVAGDPSGDVDPSAWLLRAVNAPRKRIAQAGRRDAS